MAQTTLSSLLTKLTRKFGNQSTKYFTNEDRVDAINYARNILGLYDFPELIKVSSLSFSSTTLNGNTVARATEPTDLSRIVKLWDTSTKAQYQYLTPDQFDQGGFAQAFTREYSSGTRYIFVNPSTVTGLALRYVKTVSQWTTADGAESNEFDERYDDTIIDGAIGWLEQKRRNFADFTEFDEQYKLKVKRMFQDLANPGGWQQYNRLTLYAEKFDVLNSFRRVR